MKKIISLLMIPVMGLLALSCEKEPGQEGGNSGAAVLGISVTGLPEVVEVPENQSQSFEVVVISNPGPSEAIQVTLGTDESLVAKYNAAYGTAYEMLPTAAYELPSSALMVMKYNKISVPSSLKLIGAGCEVGKTYLLPVVVASVKGNAAYEAPEDRVAYVVFKMLAAQMEGAGTQADPFKVKNIDEFNKLGNVLKTDETVYVKLVADLDYNGAAWSQANAAGAPIVLDGDNHVVKNVVAEHSLFFALEGTVKNLTFDNIVLSVGAENAGLLAGTAGVDAEKTYIQNVTVTNSKVTNTGHVGGLVGKITNAVVDNVHVACDVDAVDRVGGMFGHTIGTEITNSSATGSVTAGSYYSGGLVGMFHSSSVKNSFATGNVTQTAGGYARIGGLIGQMILGCTVEKCYATGIINATGYFGGGLIGVVETVETVDGKETIHTATVKQSYATGSVTLTGNTTKDAGAGGLVGRFEIGKLVVTDCYATGAINADRFSAGFVGDINAKAELVITNGYYKGDLSGLGPDAAGVHSDGVAIGCLRTPDSITVKCSGFVAWNTLDTKKFSYQDLVPSSGNYFGAEGTVSEQAQKFGWDSSIWDFSAAEPKLK